MLQNKDQALSKTQVTEIAKHALKSELTAAAIYTRLAEKFRDQEISQKLEEFVRLSRRVTAEVEFVPVVSPLLFGNARRHRVVIIVIVAARGGCYRQQRYQ